MRLRRSRFLIASFGWIASLAIPGCAAPTLPLPPPTALVSAPSAEGMVTVTGIADDSAYVFVWNDETQAGVIERADETGAYAAQIAARSGNVLEVWFMSGARTSPAVVREVP